MFVSFPDFRPPTGDPILDIFESIEIVLLGLDSACRITVETSHFTNFMEQNREKNFLLRAALS